MIISRHKYDQALKEAYEKGRYEAEDRCYRDRTLERVYEALHKLEERIRKVEGKPDPADNIPCVEPGIII